jgi:hypothetical protein
MDEWRVGEEKKKKRTKMGEEEEGKVGLLSSCPSESR